jgi:hypothetical protein
VATDEESGAGSAGAVGASGGPLDARDRELDLARERLSFYESFDRLIQDNISRSGDLLRQAIALRENASREIEESHAAAEARVVAERERNRAVFAALLDELTQLQQQADRLARRVGDALATIDTPSGVDAAAPQAAIEPAPPAPPVEEAAALPEEESVAPPIEEVVPPSMAVEDTVVPEEPAAPPTPAEAEIDAAVAAELEAVPAEVVPPPDASPGEPAEAAPHSMTVLVHGVPKATMALSLQRHLAGLSHVESVEAREYAEGILRLQVTVREPLAVDDLRAWEGGAGIEPVHVLQDVIEVRLPGATGP